MTLTPARPVRDRLVGLWRSLSGQLARFGVVGVWGFVTDVGLFNLLAYGGRDPLMADHLVGAKVVSSLAATLVSWLGNRYWTFRHTRRANVPHELALFTVTCTVGLGISLLILWFSRDVLGLTSPLEVNVAANGVGLVAATAFRFWAYRRFVFTRGRDAGRLR